MSSEMGGQVNRVAKAAAEIRIGGGLSTKGPPPPVVPLRDSLAETNGSLMTAISHMESVLALFEGPEPQETAKQLEPGTIMEMAATLERQASKLAQGLERLRSKL